MAGLRSFQQALLFVQGKTGWAIDYFNDNKGYYEKDKSKYWNNFDYEDNVLFDDIELTDAHQLGNLKKWA